MKTGIKHIGWAVALICVNLAAARAASASAEVLVKWNLDGLSRSGPAANQADPANVHPAVESSALTAGVTLEPTAWFDSLTVYAKGLRSDLAGAAMMDHYFSFTITPKKDKKISYSEIFNRVSINTGNLETGASIKFILTSSATGLPPADGSAPPKPLDSFIVKHPAQNDKATTVTETFDVSGFEALQKVDKPVEFRIYAVRIDGIGNRMGYGHIFYKDGQDDLRVMGTVE